MRDYPGPGTAEVSGLVRLRYKLSAGVTRPLTAPVTGALGSLQVFTGGGERLVLQRPVVRDNSNNCPGSCLQFQGGTILLFFLSHGGKILRENS